MYQLNVFLAIVNDCALKTKVIRATKQKLALIYFKSEFGCHVWNFIRRSRRITNF